MSEPTPPVSIIPGPYQHFVNFSDDLFEGIISQEWNTKDDEDPVWRKLNELKKELVDLGLLFDPPNFHRDIQGYKAKESEQRNEIIKKIVLLLERFNEWPKPIGMLSRNRWANVIFDECIGITLDDDGEINYTFIHPRKRARMLLLLSRIYLLLRSNRYSTKRDLYYKDRSAYRNQYICDNLIEDLCCITHHSRKELHILSCPKGLVYGRLKFRVGDVRYNCTDYDFGLTISQDIDLIEDIESDAKFILLVEKDASFQHFINQKILDKFPIIMITGRGFPDADTRRILKVLISALSIPVLGMVDANPWGLEILCIYRYGSLSMAHDAKNCTIPQIRWLGLLPSEIHEGKIPKENADPLSEKDREKIQQLRRRPYIRYNKLWAQELDIIERIDRKAELQAIEDCVETYLPNKIQNGLWL